MMPNIPTTNLVTHRIATTITPTARKRFSTTTNIPHVTVRKTPKSEQFRQPPYGGTMLLCLNLPTNPVLHHKLTAIFIFLHTRSSLAPGGGGGGVVHIRSLFLVISAPFPSHFFGICTSSPGHRPSHFFGSSIQLGRVRIIVTTEILHRNCNYITRTTFLATHYECHHF